MINLSQFEEAAFVAGYFGSHVGSFIDIGCSGGVALSNTFQLGLFGWSGLLVEPSPINFANLVQNYHNRGNYKFLNAALWTERALMPFHLNFGFGSSLFRENDNGRFYGTYHVLTVSPEDLKALQPDAEFISLDIEYADRIVFPSLFDAYPKCMLWCLEHVNDAEIRRQWMELFEIKRLKIVHETPENYLVDPI